jgi:hypothetical protein
MTVGTIMFASGSIVFVVFALFTGPSLSPLLGVVLISGAVAVAGILVVLIGGFREGAGGQVVYVRRIPVAGPQEIAGPPRFCAGCGSELAAAAGATSCPACGAAV